MYGWLFIGVAVGVLVTIPLVWVAVRRTERRIRRLEQRARAAERLAELGTLTGGLAHEIKNPLSSIGLNVQLIREDLADITANPPAAPGTPGAASGAGDERVPRMLRRFDSLSRETTRLREILEDFLRFAGRVQLELIPVELNGMIDELVDFFTPQAQAAGVTIRTQLAAVPSTILGDRSLLKQALLNLLINATQAIAEAREKKLPMGAAESQPELLIRTERGRAPKPDDRDEIIVHVTDTGPGIAPDLQAKIFQPYFTTKKSGTGLGLPTARRIIEEHGGTIAVHSEPGRGTDFCVTLRAASPEEMVRADDDSADARP